MTGSKFFLSDQNSGVLIDCGLYQGLKELRLRNWQPLPIDISKITCVVLTHAHIDHSGFLPKICSQGYNNKIYSTNITKEISEILLKDSAYLQEEEARFANKYGFSKHSPALPLYTLQDAEKALKLFRGFNYEEKINISNDLTFKFLDAGHIFGSAMISFTVCNSAGKMKIIFSGDIGRISSPLLKDPAVVSEADYLILESTYGNRLHEKVSVEEELSEAINDTLKRRGVVVIPAFAVERTQSILYSLLSMRRKKLIPFIPIYVDSPMAVSITKIFYSHPEICDKDDFEIIKTGIDPFKSKEIYFIEKTKDSKELNDIRKSAIIISASGMATGGRILHHLKRRLPDEKNTVLLVGYQAEGTRGRRLADGEREIKIHGEYVQVRAKIKLIHGFSGHADYAEIIQWLKKFKKLPKKIFLVHGELEAMKFLSSKINEELKVETYIPEYLEKVILQSPA